MGFNVKMKKLILWLILGAIVLLFAKCVHITYIAFKDFPEYASSDILSKKYSKLIADIDKNIVNDNTFLSLGASLETVNYPENTLYVGIKKEVGENVLIKGEALSESRKIFIKNGFGYGNLGDQNIIVIARSIDKLDLEEVVIYLSHED